MDTIQAEFLRSASKPEHFPNLPFPEVAFIGRSNVGKSSLINSLVSRKNLAHISSTPGKTQQINFFQVKDSFVLVDMPGFGYAKVSKQERHVWKSLNEEYLVKRDKLTLVCYLVDSRHDPQPIDLASIELLENLQRRYVVILTKKDKISTKLTEERVEQLRSLTQFCSHCADILPYSVVQSDTRANLWAIIKREISK